MQLRTKDIPVPKFVCTACDDPKPFGIFDCQLTLQMIASADGRSKNLKVEDVSIQDPDPRLFDAKFQGPDAEKAQSAADYMKKPLDLDILLRAPTADEQAQLLSVANPFTSSSGNSNYKSYSRHESEDEGGGDQTDQKEPQEDAKVKHPPKGKSLGRVNIRR